MPDGLVEVEALLPDEHLAAVGAGADGGGRGPHGGAAAHGVHHHVAIVAPRQPPQLHAGPER